MSIQQKKNIGIKNYKLIDEIKFYPTISEMLTADVHPKPRDKIVTSSCIDQMTSGRNNNKKLIGSTRNKKKLFINIPEELCK